MSFYQNSYVPAFSTNHTYGNFYDSSRVSLISVPERLKNYDLDVRKANTPTTASEYGDFLRGGGVPHRGLLTYATLQRQQAELMMQQQYQQQQHLQQQQQVSFAAPEFRLPLGAQQQLPDDDDAAQLQSPPVSPPPPPPLPQQQQQQKQQPYQYRTSRARSPPPPPEVSTYRANPDFYTGKAPQPQQSPQQPPQPQQPPPLRLAGQEVHLPSIESVEVRMRDNSKVVLDVMDFYRRYLRD